MYQVDDLHIRSHSLASGVYGRSYKGKLDQKGGGELRVFVKAIRKDKKGDPQKEKAALVATIPVLQSIAHPNLVSFVGVVDESSKLQVLYEWIEGVTVRSCLLDSRPPTWQSKYHVATETAVGISYLHEKGLVHGYLSTSHLLISGSDFKVVEWGMAALYPKHVFTAASSGNSGWVPPELVLGTPPSKSSDSYSFGILLLELALGKPLPNDLRKSSHPNGFDEGLLRSLVPPDCPPVFVDLGLDCIVSDPAQRPSFAQIVDRIQESKVTPVFSPLKEKKGRSGSDVSSSSKTDSRPASPLSILSPHLFTPNTSTDAITPSTPDATILSSSPKEHRGEKSERGERSHRHSKDISSDSEKSRDSPSTKHRSKHEKGERSHRHSKDIANERETNNSNNNNNNNNDNHIPVTIIEEEETPSVSIIETEITINGTDISVSDLSIALENTEVSIVTPDSPQPTTPSRPDTPTSSPLLSPSPTDSPRARSGTKDEAISLEQAASSLNTILTTTTALANTRASFKEAVNVIVSVAELAAHARDRSISTPARPAFKTSNSKSNLLEKAGESSTQTSQTSTGTNNNKNEKLFNNAPTLNTGTTTTTSLLTIPMLAQTRPISSTSTITLLDTLANDTEAHRRPKLSRTGTVALRGVASANSAVNSARFGFSSLLRPRKETQPAIKPGSVLVVDNGSCFIKAGVAGEDIPRAVLPPVKGVLSRSKSSKANYIGFKAWETEGLTLSSAIDADTGAVNWNVLTDIWEHVFFQELKADPGAHPLVISELPDMTRKSCDTMAEIMFELFEVPDLYIANQALMALYSMGAVTGIVVDCGNRMQIVPVVQGYTLSHASFRLQPAHGNLTDYLSRLMTERGYYYPRAKTAQITTSSSTFTSSTPTQSQLNEVRKIKEHLCYVALDYEKELAACEKNPKEFEREYTLPDGRTVVLGSERFRCPEALFQPEMIGADRKGLHINLSDCIQKAPMDNRMDLYEKVVLAGGSTLFPGFAQRLKKELQAIVPSSAKRRINITAPGNRKYSAWFGGSVFGTLPSFLDHCVTKESWEELGPAVLYES
eukprot:TRINITY_DN2466_c1_g1_i1.p1 TRINITY_DN2466_c1_g1~~TRINITY_DN2466_c1_g1_i1.p1  ORF type:complete len:1060 (-),score=243.32 TRINITY_DN2466_c1_g1_i1:239-3418(-)